MSLALEWKQEERPSGSDSGHAREIAAREQAQRARANHRRSLRQRRVFACFVAVCTAVTGLLILSVFLQVSVAQNELKTRELERQIALEARHQEEIRAEIATLESPSRVEKLAVEKLKMVQVAKLEYLEAPSSEMAEAKEAGNLADEEGVLSEAAWSNGGEGETAKP